MTSASAHAADATPSIDPSLRVAILGTGFAGLGMAIRLRELGHRQFVCYEAADDLGGTWRDNTYPGCGCDVPSHLYSFSFARNPNWSRSFAPQPEILDYMRDCADRWDLHDAIRFGHEVVSARYDEAKSTWTLTFSNGRTAEADVVVSGCGGLSRPVLPTIEGIDDFDGPHFHSARWDHDVDLRGKRVGVIGTGASAIQIVPSIASEVGELTVFQRTPPWILPKADRPLSKTLRSAFAHVPGLQNFHRQQLYWVMELMVLGMVHEPRLLRALGVLARRFLRKSVPDPALRRALTPDYSIGCKRILFSNDYFRALQRRNVTLETTGIERVEARGVRTTDGRLHELDVIVYATGFQASDACAPFHIEGARGQTLHDAWADAARAYRGTTVHGFPNLFLLVGPNTGLGHSSMIYMIESQVQYIAEALCTMTAHGWRSVEVREVEQRRYNEDLQRRLANTVWESGCSSWYKNAAGINTTLWPGFTWQFRSMLRTFDADAYQRTT